MTNCHIIAQITFLITSKVHQLKMRSSVVILTVLLPLLFSLQINCNPLQFSRWGEYERYVQQTGAKITFSKDDNACKNKPELQNLCEKCAKVTKNEVVYPLCCQDRHGVTEWCVEFLEYKPPESSSS